MYKLIKGILVLSSSLIVTVTNAQSGGNAPMPPPFPSGPEIMRNLDTIRRKDAGGWEFMQVRLPDHKTVYSEGSLHNGIKEGAWTTYWETGFPKTITCYTEGKKNGSYIETDPGGAIVKLINYKNDKLEGPSRTYMSRGSMTEESYYSNGEKNGMCFKYYANRNKQQETNYVNGYPDGLATWYFESGQKMIEYSYVNGKISGNSTTYYENGKVREMGEYKDDKQTGIWKEFFENGLERGEGMYNADGEKEGTWKQFDIEGKPTTAIKYHKGEAK